MLVYRIVSTVIQRKKIPCAILVRTCAAGLVRSLVRWSCSRPCSTVLIRSLFEGLFESPDVSLEDDFWKGSKFLWPCSRVVRMPCSRSCSRSCSKSCAKRLEQDIEQEFRCGGVLFDHLCASCYTRVSACSRLVRNFFWWIFSLHYSSIIGKWLPYRGKSGRGQNLTKCWLNWV